MFLHAALRRGFQAGKNVGSLKRSSPFGMRGKADVALPSSSTSGGSSFMQRMLAFLAGLGVGCGGSFFVIYEELGNSNARFTKHFHDLQKRVDALEK